MYFFDLGSKQCDVEILLRAYIMIKVLDVDEFAPKFDNESYFAEVEEGKIYDSIVKVHASDEDESSAFGSICGYELLTTGIPFEVTSTGDVKNKEPLDYSIHRNFILEVSLTTVETDTLY